MCSLQEGFGKNIAVDFLDPPKNLYPLLLNLQKSRNFEVQVVAHPDAFFVDPEKEILGWADPIITVVRDNCVAVLAQYGDFKEGGKATETISGIDFMPF